mmetsp:Transcript_16091/g.37184  ORF Transcript_16091/g.37184 Transcript_16091/m.37184 type:complete len:209 (-) Transcript_16091:908-1534(-)
MVFQDRIAAMVLLLATLVVVVLMMLALFSVAPIFTSCLFGLLYCLYYFIANESSSAMHHAQEFENRFWTLFAVLLASASLFVPDSPVPMVCLSANCKLILVVIVGYGVHMWDRMVHRKEMSRQVAGLGHCLTCLIEWTFGQSASGQYEFWISTMSTSIFTTSKSIVSSTKSSAPSTSSEKKAMPSVPNTSCSTGPRGPHGISTVSLPV